MIKEKKKKKADYSCLAASYTEKPLSRGAYSLINIYRTETNSSLHQSYIFSSRGNKLVHTKAVRPNLSNANNTI